MRLLRKWVVLSTCVCLALTASVALAQSPGEDTEAAPPVDAPLIDEADEFDAAADVDDAAGFQDAQDEADALPGPGEDVEAGEIRDVPVVQPNFVEPRGPAAGPADRDGMAYVMRRENGTVYGVVRTVNPLNGRTAVVNDARVTVVRGGRTLARARTSSDGSFVVGGLQPGMYSFVVSSPLGSTAVPVMVEPYAPGVGPEAEETTLMLTLVPDEDLAEAAPAPPPGFGAMPPPTSMGGGGGGGGPGAGMLGAAGLAGLAGLAAFADDDDGDGRVIVSPFDN